jgi:hypothetical protein
MYSIALSLQLILGTGQRDERLSISPDSALEIARVFLTRALPHCSNQNPRLQTQSPRRRFRGRDSRRGCNDGRCSRCGGRLAPDRLSRKYAYQILLIEELARNGVETLFVKAPHHQGPFPAAGPNGLEKLAGTVYNTAGNWFAQRSDRH